MEIASINMTKGWKKVCLDLARSAPIPIPPPRLHHAPPAPTFVCLPMSRGSELPETLRAQIVVLKQWGRSWAEIGAFLGVLPDTARKAFLRREETKCYTSSPRVRVCNRSARARSTPLDRADRLNVGPTNDSDQSDRFQVGPC